MARLALVLGLVLALGLLGLGVFAWWQGRSAGHQLAAAAAQAGTSTVSAGQAEAATQALRITVAGDARDRADDEISEENRNALAQAPGADQVLDPGFVQRLDDGLSRHDAYRDDVGGPGLREPDPADVPAASAAGPPS